MRANVSPDAGISLLAAPVDNGDCLLTLSDRPSGASYNITIMRKIKFVPDPRLLATPRCESCGESTWLVAIEPDSPDHDKRTFECPRCQDVVVKVVKYK